MRETVVDGLWRRVFCPLVTVLLAALLGPLALAEGCALARVAYPRTGGSEYARGADGDRDGGVRSGGTGRLPAGRELARAMAAQTGR